MNNVKKMMFVLVIAVGCIVALFEGAAGGALIFTGILLYSKDIFELIGFDLYITGLCSSILILGGLTLLNIQLFIDQIIICIITISALYIAYTAINNKVSEEA